MLIKDEKLRKLPFEKKMYDEAVKIDLQRHQELKKQKGHYKFYDGEGYFRKVDADKLEYFIISGKLKKDKLKPRRYF